MSCVFLKGCFHGRHEKGSDGLWVAESHFRLTGVDINIDLARWHLQESDEERKTSCRHGVAVGDAHDACKRSILYGTTVDEEELFGRAVGVERGKRAEGLQTHALLLCHDGKSVFQKEFSQDLRDSFFRGGEGEGLAACGQKDLSFFVVEAFELHIGIGEGDSFYLREDEGGFVGVATEESQSCGCCKEEVLYLYVGALRQDGGFGFGDFSGFDENLEGISFLCAAFDERAADRGDGSKRFAAKAEGVNIQQVVFGQLGGCVSFDGEQQAFFVHTAAVVLHA